MTAYALLPRVRRGMATAIAVADTGQAGQAAVASFQVQLSVGGSAVQTAVRLYGPGDVTTIDPGGGLTWGQRSDAAQMASFLLRQPVRVAIHATALLGG